MAKPVILAVDDDPQVLRAVERDLRRKYARDYRVLRAESGETALDTLGKLKLRGDPVALFLVDQRMPRMTGVEFLERVKEPFPEAKRALLTAYSDTDAAIRAINDIKLLDNAIDAVADGDKVGRIGFRTTSEGDGVLVEITDDGPGIPREIQNRIFEPFFTTKEIGLGTGLGLDTVRRIVAGHGGEITFDSEPGETRFTVRLPIEKRNSEGGEPDGT